MIASMMKEKGNLSLYFLGMQERDKQRFEEIENLDFDSQIAVRALSSLSD